MKLNTLFALFLFATLSFSCSKCYDCTTQVEIEITDENGNVTGTDSQTVSEEICTADENEVDNKEADGYSCS